MRQQRGNQKVSNIGAVYVQIDVPQTVKQRHLHQTTASTCQKGPRAQAFHLKYICGATLQVEIALPLKLLVDRWQETHTRCIKWHFKCDFWHLLIMGISSFHPWNVSSKRPTNDTWDTSQLNMQFSLLTVETLSGWTSKSSQGIQWAKS